MAELMKRVTTVMAMAAILLALVSPLGAFPAFQTGYWNLIDSSFLAILVSGILAAGSIILRILGSQNCLPGIPASAKFLIILAFAGFVAALNADFPLVAIVGTYQSGYGPVWHLVAALMVVVVCDLKRHEWAMRSMAVTATAVALTLSIVLAYSLLTSNTILIPSSDNYGLIGFLLLFFPDGGRRDKKAARIQFWTLRISAVILILLSQNMTLIVLVGLGLSLGGGGWLLSRGRRGGTGPWIALKRVPVWGIAALVIALASLPLGLILTGAVDVGGATLRMRAVIADIMVAALQHSSLSDWLIGHGWGSTQAAFYQYLHWGNMVLYTKSWDFLWRDIFHSHNFVLETVYSVGGLGLIFMLTFLISVYTGAPGYKRTAALAFISGYVLYSSVWYDLSFHLPYMSLALASFAGPIEADGRVGKFGGGHSKRILGAKWPLTTISAATVVFLSVIAISYGRFSNRVYALKPENRSIENGTFSTAKFPDDPRASDFVRSMLYRDVLRRLKRRPALHNAKGLAVLDDLISDVERRLPTTRSPGLVLIGLDIFDNITFLPEWTWAASAIDGKGDLWKNFAWRSLDLAPFRSDLLIPYLTHLLAARRYEEIEAMVSKIQLNKPDDPVGLYYLGAVQSQSQDIKVRQRGLLAIAKAMDCGIDRFMEIPKWLAELVSTYRSKRLGCPI